MLGTRGFDYVAQPQGPYFRYSVRMAGGSSVCVSPGRPEMGAQRSYELKDPTDDEVYNLPLIGSSFSKL